MFTLGCIGVGNMGGALLAAVRHVLPAEEIAVCCRTEEHTASAAEKFGARAMGAEEIFARCRYIFLGIKPYQLEDFVKEHEDAIRSSGAVLVSMIAGADLARLSRLFSPMPAVRILPNTPCAVGAGLIYTCTGAGVSDRQAEEIRSLLGAAGQIEEIPETYADVLATLAGCGPAFTYMFAEALADGAVACGLPRAIATRAAAGMLAGSAQMILQSGKHPEQLKDEVCSPGGTTIRGVYALEEGGMRAAAMRAVIDAYEKTKTL